MICTIYRPNAGRRWLVAFRYHAESDRSQNGTKTSVNGWVQGL